MPYSLQMRIRVPKACKRAFRFENLSIYYIILFTYITLIESYCGATHTTVVRWRNIYFESYKLLLLSTNTFELLVSVQIVFSQLGAIVNGFQGVSSICLVFSYPFFLG